MLPERLNETSLLGNCLALFELREEAVLIVRQEEINLPYSTE